MHLLFKIGQINFCKFRKVCHCEPTCRQAGSGFGDEAILIQKQTTLSEQIKGIASLPAVARNDRMRFFAALSLVALLFSACSLRMGWDKLNNEDQRLVNTMLAQWRPWIQAKVKDGTAPLITFAELEKGLSVQQKGLLTRIRRIDPKRSFAFPGEYFGLDAPSAELKRLVPQWIKKNDRPFELPPQYLPAPVQEACERMMQAMENALGKRLYVESGYRSPAYQLYNFIFYLKQHDYSLTETGKLNALPGYSEHGAPARQAVDFINEEGINGDAKPEEFEALAEYRWLEKNAKQFGFELSYPRGGQGISFEPWHWRYTAGAKP